MSAHLFTTRLISDPTTLRTVLPPPRPVKVGWHSLTDMLPGDMDIRDWHISPDSRYVVCHTQEMRPNGRQSLYSLPICGGSPIKLTPALLVGGDIWRFAITPDSRSVVYTAHQERAYRLNLYSVPITGGPAVKLDNQLARGGIGVGDFKIDPNGTRVVFSRDRFDRKAHFRLFSVPTTGGVPIALNPGLADGGDVVFFDIDPARERVVYVAIQGPQGRKGLFSVHIDGGLAAKINPPHLDVDNRFEIYHSHSYPTVVFSATPGGLNCAELYRTPTDGSGAGALTKLSHSLNSSETVIGYHISPDGTRIVYNVATGTYSNPNPSRGILYSVPYRGGVFALLSPTAVPGFGVQDNRFVITADSQRVVYEHQANATTNPVLESVTLKGDDRKLLYTSGFGERLGDWQVSPNDEWVVYEIQPSSSAYSIPTIGGTPIPLGNENSFLLITPDSHRVVYATNQLSGHWHWDLYSQPITGGGIRNLSQVAGGASVADYAASPDGRWIIFRVCYPTGACELRVSDGREVSPIHFLPLGQQ